MKGSDDRMWVVTELRFGAQLRPAAVLTATCGGVTRRIEQYPDNWHELSDDQLSSLVELSRQRADE